MHTLWRSCWDVRLSVGGEKAGTTSLSSNQFQFPLCDSELGLSRRELLVPPPCSGLRPSSFFRSLGMKLSHPTLSGTHIQATRGAHPGASWSPAVGGHISASTGWALMLFYGPSLCGEASRLPRVNTRPSTSTPPAPSSRGKSEPPSHLSELGAVSSDPAIHFHLKKSCFLFLLRLESRPWEQSAFVLFDCSV